MNRLIYRNIIGLALLAVSLPLPAQETAGSTSPILRADVCIASGYPDANAADSQKRISIGNLMRKVVGADTKSDYTIKKPVAIHAIDSNNIWYVDQGNEILAQFIKGKMQTGKPFLRGKILFQSLVGISPGPGNGMLFTDSRLGNIYLLSKDTRSILVFNDTNKLRQPTGIAYSPVNHEIWVSETEAHCISIFDSTGKKIRSFGSRGTGPGEFNFPTSLCIDAAGNVYVVDALNFRVQIFNSEGKLLSMFGKTGNATGYFARPKGIALDSYGNIYVADALFNAVQIFDQKGNFLLSFGRQGREAGQFWMPSGISIDKEDNIYVADTYNSRIQRFKLCNIVKRGQEQP